MIISVDDELIAITFDYNDEDSDDDHVNDDADDYDDDEVRIAVLGAVCPSVRHVYKVRRVTPLRKH